MSQFSNGLAGGLILPAAVAVALAAALLGAPAAHADGACNLRYVFNSDSSPVWSSMQANSYGQVHVAIIGQ